MNRVPIDIGKPNPLQAKTLKAFREGARFVLMVSGRQGGKSHLGARWLAAEVARSNSDKKLFAAVSPTFPMSAVVDRKLKEVFRSEKGLWDRVKYRAQPYPTYEFENGAIIEVRSAHDPDSLRGPTYDAVWFDEIAKASKEAYDVVLPTLLASGGRLLGTTTPRGKQNWVYKAMALKGFQPEHPQFDADYYNPHYRVIAGSTWDNVANLSSEAISLLEEQYGKNTSFGRQEVAGEFVSFEGLVYQWDEERNLLKPQRLPDLDEYTTIIGGIDFGWHPDPFAAVVLGYKDGVWYALDEVYESRLLVNDQANHLAAMGEAYGVQAWYADSARPDNIADFGARGLPVLPVVKPLIEDRVQEMAMFTDSNRFKVATTCVETVGELGRYQYPDDEKLAAARLKNPIDKDNHLMDAIGYALWSTRYLWRNDARYRIKRKVKSPFDDEQDPYFKMLGNNKSFGVSGVAGS